MWDKYFSVIINQIIEVPDESSDEIKNKRKKINILNSYNISEIKQIIINKYMEERRIEYKQYIKKNMMETRLALVQMKEGNLENYFD